MRFSSRKLIVGMAAAAAVVISVGQAWACVGLVAFRVVGSSVVEPGGTVQVFGGEFARGNPVEIRLDSPDGPILATHPDPMPSTMTSRFNLDVPIPEDISAGPHLLVATQQHYDMNVGIPARAAIYVNTSAPAASEATERPATLAVSEGPSAVPYILIGLGVAAGGVLLAAAASMFASRKASSGQAEGARS